MYYGLPYKGSKNKLAKKIVAILPQRKHLYDLFCGGCAVTHAAMMGRKFEDFHINDINWMCPQLFTDAVNGKYENENRWISREEFHRLKSTDPYVASVWSFGNNMEDYMYGADIEQWKKALHYAVFFSDYSLAKEQGWDLSFVDGTKGIYQRWLKIKNHIQHSMRVDLQSLERLQRLQSLQRLQRLESLQRLQRLQSLQSLQRTCDDYQSVEIQPDSVIYCDIPYRNTDGYAEEGFDHERFYDWACRQTEPVFISEYWMPEDRFTCIQEFTHRSTLCATANNAVCERLFIPKHQQVKGSIQLSLF